MDSRLSWDVGPKSGILKGANQFVDSSNVVSGVECVDGIFHMDANTISNSNILGQNNDVSEDNDCNEDQNAVYHLLCDENADDSSAYLEDAVAGQHSEFSEEPQWEAVDQEAREELEDCALNADEVCDIIPGEPEEEEEVQDDADVEEYCSGSGEEGDEDSYGDDDSADEEDQGQIEGPYELCDESEDGDDNELCEEEQELEHELPYIVGDENQFDNADAAEDASNVEQCQVSEELSGQFGNVVPSTSRQEKGSLNYSVTLTLTSACFIVSLKTIYFL